MSTSPDQITLTTEQKKWLAQIADELGMPWDTVLGEALMSYRSKADISLGDESFYAAASRFGLIGCVQGGPADLSSNPKYMEGFGKSEP